ncbi:galectin-related protein-like [Periophthalmus magnuspinnatus]|uniref:galectin-related protein-like n=1 Tax=Periophthalmus magnuspinnatus TaxID=409849 RepID=UPI00145A9BD1|nr:galectin-related protein-like [Periophthalmus magnuspinnatus]
MERAGTEDKKRPGSAASDSLSKNLSVPFRGHISGGLRPGKRLQLVGMIDPKPDRFYVALTCGIGSERPPEDVAIELCVRFKDRQVQRRACVGGVWGSSQSDAPFFPFIRGQPFRLEIHCEQSRLRFFVDGEKLFDFSHKITCLNQIDTLWVRGSVALTKLA